MSLASSPTEPSNQRPIIDTLRSGAHQIAEQVLPDALRHVLHRAAGRFDILRGDEQAVVDRSAEHILRNVEKIFAGEKPDNDVNVRMGYEGDQMIEFSIFGTHGLNSNLLQDVLQRLEELDPMNEYIIQNPTRGMITVLRRPQVDRAFNERMTKTIIEASRIITGREGRTGDNIHWIAGGYLCEVIEFDIEEPHGLQPGDFQLGQLKATLSRTDHGWNYEVTHVSDTRLNVKRTPKTNGTF